jgi:hypothetical protein
MSAHIRALDAAGERAGTRPLKITFGMLVAMPAFALWLAGCTDAPRAPVAGTDPSDPRARTPRVDYRSTTGSYKSQRPVDPAPWTEQNERVAPTPKSGQ